MTGALLRSEIAGERTVRGSFRNVAGGGGDNMGWVVRTGNGGIDVGGEIDLSGASSAGLCK